MNDVKLSKWQEEEGVRPVAVSADKKYLNFKKIFAVHLVLLVPVVDGVPVVDVGGGGAGGLAPAPALPLHPGGAVRVHLGAHRVGRAHGEVSLGLLKREQNMRRLHIVF